MPALFMKNRPVIRIFLLSALLLVQIVGVGLTKVASSPVSPAEGLQKKTSVQMLLRDAKIAHDAGQFARAECLWLQIHKLYPQQSKPAWLKTERPTVYPAAVDDRQNLLNLASQTTDPLIKNRLEALVKANPLDKEARNALLSMAQRQGDKVAALRHKSIVQPVSRSHETNTLKILLAVFIIGAIFWCLFSASPGSKSADKPEGEPLWREIVVSAREFLKRHK